METISISGTISRFWRCKESHLPLYDAQGQLAAEYSSAAAQASACGTCYLTADTLGSTRMITDETATPRECHDYLSFGDEIGRTTGCYAAQTSNTLKFTGKERDVETGLDHFGARYLSAAQGRFTSADPKVVGNSRLLDPQRWNLYGYARDNPLLFVDPDGREIILFYRPPDPVKSSLQDFGHVILYVRNDRSGRSGVFDYYPDPGRSAVHRTVTRDRLRDHAGVVIKSNPAAEERMLNKMDTLTKQDPAFHANLDEVAKRTESDCVSTTEEILKAGDIDSSARTPTGLWEDLFGDWGVEARGMTPGLGMIYKDEAGKHFDAMNKFIDQVEERRKQEEAEKKKTNGQ